MNILPSTYNFGGVNVVIFVIIGTSLESNCHKHSGSK